MNAKGQTQKLGYSDLLGVSASGLCAIHCAIAPLLFASKPLLESTLGEHGHSHGPGFWALLDYLFLLLSLVAVWYSAKHTSHKKIKAVLWIAWVVFSLGLLSESFHFERGKWFMYMGSIVLVVAHTYNHRYHKNWKSQQKITTPDNL